MKYICELYLSSSFDCVVFLDGKPLTQLFKNINEKQLLTVPFLKNFTLQIYPIKNICSLPYIVNFSFSRRYNVQQEPFFECHEIGENVFDIKFMPYNYNAQLTNYYLSEKIDNINIKVDNKINSVIEVTNKNESFSIPTNHNLNESIIKKSTFNGLEYITVLSKCENNLSHLLVFNVKNNEIWQKTANKIEINKNIKILTFCNDLLNHGKVEEYSLENEGAKKIKRYLVFLNSEPTTKNINVGLAFLQCMMLEDFKSARLFLSDQLNKRLDDEHLAEFFPKIKKILPCKNLINVFCVTFLQGDIYYKIDIENEKIVNVSEYEY